MNYKPMEKTERTITSIKNFMKENGITNRMLSVRQGGRSSLNDNIYITQKDLKLKYYELKKTFESLEKIRWDEYAQEILSGCNTFIDYEIDRNKLAEYIKENKLEERAAELLKEVKNKNGCGIELIANDERMILFTDELFIETEEETAHWHSVAPYTIAKYLAFYQLGYFEPLKDYQERKQKQEQEAEEARKRAEEAHKNFISKQQKEINLILSDYIIKEIPEEKQEIKIYKWANLNKNNTLKEYKEEVRNGDYYSQKGKITHVLEFTNWQAAEAFSNNLLSSFDFLKDKGGTYEDNEEYINKVISVRYSGNEYFVIDTQGYSYARYVGLRGLV